MAQRYYYYLANLPSLGQLGTPAPMSLVALLEQLSDCPAHQVAATIILSDDLLQRDGLLAGETQDATPAVLTVGQARDEDPLPEYIFANFEKPDTVERRVAADETWEAYFRYADDVAGRSDCGFLKEWVGFEVALRNALARTRAKTLGLEPEEYLVAAELGSDDDDFTNIVNEWSSAENPLAGLRVLDRSRMHWLNENDNWYSFINDELAAYAAKLMLLHRWQRLTSEKDDAGTSAA